MKHYFISVSTHGAKNKAHLALQDHVMEYHHKLVDEDNLEEIISSIKIMKDAVNEAYPRCQDIDLCVHSYAAFDHVGVSVDSNFNMIAQMVKGFMIDEPILL